MFNGTVQKWDVKTGQEVSVSVPENLNFIKATALSPQATLFAAQNAALRETGFLQTWKHYYFVGLRNRGTSPFSHA